MQTDRWACARISKRRTACAKSHDHTPRTTRPASDDGWALRAHPRPAGAARCRARAAAVRCSEIRSTITTRQALHMPRDPVHPASGALYCTPHRTAIVLLSSVERQLPLLSQAFGARHRRLALCRPSAASMQNKAPANSCHPPLVPSHPLTDRYFRPVPTSSIAHTSRNLVQQQPHLTQDDLQPALAQTNVERNRCSARAFRRRRHAKREQSCDARTGGLARAN